MFMLGFTPLAATASERRIALRLDGGLADVLVHIAGEVEEFREVQLQDFSLSGLSFWSSEALPTDQMLCVQLPSGDSVGVWDDSCWACVRVIRSRRDLLGWIIGCRFVEEPTDAFLERLDGVSEMA